MAIDSMNKVIHAAVRRDLTRLGAALDTARDGDRRRAADLGRAWANLREHLSTPEWHAAMRQVRRQPPRAAGWFLAWLEDGGPDEARRFLASEVPAPVRLVLGRVLGRRYHRTVAPVWR